MTAILSSEILGRFGVASPELLSRRRLLRRTDSKFVMRAGDLPAIVDSLADAYRVLLAGTVPLASYRTLYFDTPELDCFHDHRRGRRPRNKIRIRHYDERGLTFLEIKTKRSELETRKYRKARPFGETGLDASDRAFIAEHSGYAGELGPTIWTDFRRLTLLSIDFNERVTIDLGLEFHRDGTRADIGDLAIVEIKQSPFCMRSGAMQALRRIGVRQASASKYCTATMLTRTGLRFNRLRPVLRTIERLSS
ncbi:MAG TPA: polyphosphate polymerase domain-containing protein [Kofleriaceae bacterium]|nr:polyphosphate polymerase domain-containing protein [Kofleriaceae bacterium]